MKASEGQTGRVFLIRLEHGDVVPDCIERFAGEKGILFGQVILVGGIGGGEIVVGPRRSEERPPQPMLLPVDGAHEVVAAGVLAPDESGKPILHMHAALSAGYPSPRCSSGVTTWLVGEIILCEILGVEATRIRDEESGFVLLEPTTR